MSKKRSYDTMCTAQSSTAPKGLLRHSQAEAKLQAVAETTRSNPVSPTPQVLTQPLLIRGIRALEIVVGKHREVKQINDTIFIEIGW